MKLWRPLKCDSVLVRLIEVAGGQADRLPVSIQEKLRDSVKKLMKGSGNFTLDLGKVCRRFVKFQNKF